MSTDQPRTIPIRVPGDEGDVDHDSSKAGASSNRKPDEMPGPPDEIEIADESLTVPDDGPDVLSPHGVIAGEGVEVEVVEDDSGRQQAPSSEADPSASTAIAQAQSAELAELRSELENTKNRMLRVAADFENFKRRAERERADAIKFANEDFLKKLIPVMDNLDRAMTHAEGQQEIEALREGVEMVFRELNKVLESFGMTSFSALNERFDPTFHEAVLYSESADVAKGHVMTEYQKGYFLRDRLLRPALVVVSKGPPEESAPHAPAEAAETAEAGENDAPDEKAP
ncbi:MAG: nucleotide exchange factor GrpE [Myxococcales bacterium]|nr:nucleotide exchange factor GrpE [Myxococcales bacterium]